MADKPRNPAKLYKCMLNHAENQLSAQFRIRSAGASVFKRIHSYRDAGTHADEWLILFKILLPMSALFTLAFGAALHYNLTLPYLGTGGAGIFAGLFTGFLEVSKTIAGIWFFRNLIFGLWRQGIPSLGMMLCGGCIFAGAMLWSYYNSTHGVSYLTQHLAPTMVERQVVDLNERTADVDARIDKTAKTADRGLSSTWKGKTTVDGLRVAKNATRVQALQEEQRLLLLQQATADQQRADEHRENFIDRVSVLLSMLGGKMEFFQLFLMVGIVLCERSLWERIKGAPGQSPTPSPNTKGYYYNSPPTTVPPATPPHRNGATANNSAAFTLHPHGSFWDAMQKTVARSPQTVARSNGPQVSTDPDAVLQLAKTRLQSHVANFADRQRRPSTTAANCADIINEVGRKMEGRGFEPTPKVAEDFYRYMLSVFEALDNNGYPYEYQPQFLAALGQFLPAEAAAA